MGSKPAARLQPGDRFFRSRKREVSASAVRRIYTVDHTTRRPYGIITIWYGKYGMQSIEAAGTHRFEVPED